MFDFLIALFGGAYYFGKFAVEKSKEVSYDRQLKARNNTIDKIRARYGATYQEQRHIKQMILSGDHYDEICEELKEDFEFVFGSEWKDILDIPPKPTYRIPVVGQYTNHTICLHCNHTYWVYHLLLAKNGKIDDMVVNGMGHNIGNDEKSVGQTTEREMCLRFTQCIEKRLLNFAREKSYINSPPCIVKFVLANTSNGDELVIESTAVNPDKTRRLWTEPSIDNTYDVSEYCDMSKEEYEYYSEKLKYYPTERLWEAKYLSSFDTQFKESHDSLSGHELLVKYDPYQSSYDLYPQAKDQFTND